MRLLAPEVIQTSAMDCGPAALKCVLEGHGIRASYARLRDACHTTVDGTSMDDLEDMARLLGLNAEQVMAPVEHVLAGEGLLPCMAVIRTPEGGTHVIVLWRQHGVFVQVMDPALGRRWITKEHLRKELYVHTHSVPVESWWAWASSESFSRTQRSRLRALRIHRSDAEQLLRDTGGADWRPAAQLDAALRMSEALAASGAVAPGREALHVLRHLNRREIPHRYHGATADPDTSEHVKIRGAVLIRIHGHSQTAPDLGLLPPEIRAVLSERTARPAREIVNLLRQDGSFKLIALAPVFAISGFAVAAEGLLLRGMLDVRLDLTLTGQRLIAWMGLLAMLCIVPVISVPRTAAVLRLSRLLEMRFRISLMRKLPLLGDGYFQSRLISDMAERAHSVHLLRSVPEFAAIFLQSGFEILAISIALCWLYPSSAPLVLLLTTVQIALPLVGLPLRSEQDLRFRTHTGALSRFYLDALIGATALRAHGGEAAIRRAHGGVLRQWAHSGMNLQTSLTLLEAAHTTAGFGLAALIVFRHVVSSQEIASALLLAYWSLTLPVLGQELAGTLWQYPMLRNVTLRLLEPLASPEAERIQNFGEEPPQALGGAEIAFREVHAARSGIPVLDDVNLTLTSGSHVAVVGNSGAGKSTLIGLLNGWHKPTRGEIFVDGVPLDPDRMDALRRCTAWVGPDVRLWNASLLDNVSWGNDHELGGIQQALALSGVDEMLAGFPSAFDSNLGDAGARLAASEAERVRICRALLRKNVRLVLLDEPCRGFDSETRRRLIDGMRRHWSEATFLCVTHDIKLAESFERVLVVEGGRVTEDGSPATLREQPSGAFQAMVDAEVEVNSAMRSTAWRRCVLRDGQIEDEPA